MACVNSDYVRLFVRLDAIRIMICRLIELLREDYISDAIRRHRDDTIYLPCRARATALINLNDYIWPHCLKHRINCGKR